MTLLRTLALLSIALAGCDAPATDDPLSGLALVTEDASDAPIADLDDAWRARFAEGDAAFEAPHLPAQGLGPAYIRASCAACHADDARGPGIVTRMSVPDEPTLAAELLPWGDAERPLLAGGGQTPVLAPDDTRVVRSTRMPNAVFGRGYLEAIDEDAILDAEEAQARAGRVSGRPNWVPCPETASAAARFPGCAPGEIRVGRFGHKARTATLEVFTAEAYLGDMSITTPMFPDELPNPDGLTDDLRAGVDLDLDTVEAVADYVRLLAIPRRTAPTGAGAALFSEVGCVDCHVTELATRGDSPIDALRGKAPVYSDLLLHDMGAALADGIVEGDAGASEWRTAPLIGLRHLRTYLHDGRARTVEEAIRAHGDPTSEARFATEAWDALSPDDRSTLLTFVESL